MRAPTKTKPSSRIHPKTKVEARAYLGDCREVLPTIPEVKKKQVDLVFADPPFNWARDYDNYEVGEGKHNKVWDDKGMSEDEYLDFTYTWLDLCSGALKPSGSMWVNIPDDTAAEIVLGFDSTIHMPLDVAIALTAKYQVNLVRLTGVCELGLSLFIYQSGTYTSFFLDLIHI